MKLFYILPVFFLSFFNFMLNAQNVNYEVKVVELMAEADADDGGIGSFLYGDQDPTWFVRAQDNAGVEGIINEQNAFITRLNINANQNNTAKTLQYLRNDLNRFLEDIVGLLEL